MIVIEHHAQRTRSYLYIAAAHILSIRSLFLAVSRNESCLVVSRLEITFLFIPYCVPSS